jgi:hypothetical protein
MAGKRRVPLHERDLKGFKYFERLQPLLEQLHAVGTQSDKAGNRLWFYDQYVSLVLLYFFNPVITSLRALKNASGFDKVQKLLGVRRTSLGSLSESAADTFDAQSLRAIVQELAEKALPLQSGREAEALRGLTAVDGSILPALPRMAWALWNGGRQRAAKLHLAFDVLKGVPADATLTPAASSEHTQLRAMLQAGRLYVLDRGYAGYQLFRDVLDAGSSLVARVKDNIAFTVDHERPLFQAGQDAGVVRDVVLSRVGTDHHKDVLERLMRLVVVRRTKPNGSTEELWLLTDRLDLDAEIVALAYRFRWTVELFFRWLKCILGCRHLISNSENGVTIQMYVALIASLLMALNTGRKPTKRTLEMMQFYLIGWASLEEVEAHLASLAAAERAAAEKAAKKKAAAEKIAADAVKYAHLLH